MKISNRLVNLAIKVTLRGLKHRTSVMGFSCLDRKDKFADLVSTTADPGHKLGVVGVKTWYQFN